MRRCGADCPVPGWQLAADSRVESQGAELMSQYGINVPPGIAVTKLDEVLPAAKKMANKQNEVSLARYPTCFEPWTGTGVSQC